MPKKHALGFGYGRIIEYEDGSAAYVKPMELSQTFRVQIADITGFSVAKGAKVLERTFNVLGNGTLLAAASVNHGVPEKLEAWFRAHPLFGSHAPVAAQPQGAAGGVADELKKLADLRDQGVITEDEFDAQKTKLLGA